MTGRIPWLIIPFASLLLLLLQTPAQAEITTVSSAISYTASTNQVIGTSRTVMDYGTQLYYQAIVDGNMYQQGAGNPVNSGTNTAPFGTSTASVTTQYPGSSNLTYTLLGRHYLLPYYYGGNYCPSPPRYIDFLGYFGTNGYRPDGQGGYVELQKNYGAAGTVFSTGTLWCIGSSTYKIYPGDTNTSIQTPTFSISMTNPRVGNLPNGSTQYALVGADIQLNASLSPSGLGGGAYSWTFSGPYSVSGGATNSSSVVIRSSQTGTITATVTYPTGGNPLSTTVYVNATLPALSSFTATQYGDLMGRSGACQGSPPTGFLWTLGCPPAGYGITFSASAGIPSAAYLSDPAQSGIKYVQALSTLRKVRFESSTVNCLTGRSTEGDTTNSWRLDNPNGGTGDPYENSPTAVRDFSQGNALTIETRDSPAQGWGTLDAVKIDDRFQMYVIYFAGGTASAPNFQVRLGSLSWNWGGQAVYDSINPIASNVPYREQVVYAQPGPRSADPVTSTVTYQGRNSDLVFTTCPWGPAPATNPIDGSRFFVLQQYKDLLATQQPDQSGWDFWTSKITACDFDANCVATQRAGVARAFFYAASFNQTDPAMVNGPGSLGFNPAVYNPAFVKHCYECYLRREPDSSFWVDVLNRTGDYDGVLNAFITSTEYRLRFGPP